MLQLALENIDCIRKKKSLKAETIKEYQIQNKEINISVRWSGLHKSSEEQVRNLLLETIRNIPENLEDETFISKLETRLVNSSIAVNSAQEILELFQSIPFNERDTTKVSVTLYSSKKSTRIIYQRHDGHTTHMETTK